MSNISKRKAYSYIRMSTDVQLKGNSLERQLEASKEYASKHNLHLIEDYRDIGISAYKSDHVSKGMLGTFIEAVEKGEVSKGSVLLVESFDRMSRDKVYKAINQFTNLILYGVEVHTTIDGQVFNESILDNNPGLLFFTLGSMMKANNESEEKVVRGKDNWSRKRRNIDNQILTAQCPFWLKAKSDKTSFDVITQYSKTIEVIFELYIDKEMGSHRITKHLNSDLKKYPPPPRSKNRWSESTIKKILNNTAVHGAFTPHTLENGKRVPTDEVIIDYFPTIVSEKTFNIARVKSDERRIKGGGRKGYFSNVFTKKLVCGHCGGSVHYFNKNTKKPNERYLRCRNSIYSSNCNAPSWSYNDFKQSFFSFASEFEFSEMLQDTSIQSQKVNLQEEIQTLETQIDNDNANFNAMISELSTLDDSVRERAKKQVNAIESTISDAEMILSELKKQLLKLEESNDISLTIELQETLIKHTDNVFEESESIREKITSQISKIVDEIVLFNQTPLFDPSGTIEDNISPIVLKHFNVFACLLRPTVTSLSLYYRLYNDISTYPVMSKAYSTSKVQLFQ